jgi:hypothetical protein
MAPRSKPQPERSEAERFTRDTCLYRGKSGEEARIFRAGEEVPPKSQGWRDHPRGG